MKYNKNKQETLGDPAVDAALQCAKSGPALVRIARQRAGMPTALAIVVRRLQNLLPAETGADIRRRTAHLLPRLTRLLPPALRFSLLRSMCNAWPTSARMQSTRKACHLCAAVDGDSLRHYAVCPAVLTSVPVVHPHYPAEWPRVADFSAFLLQDEPLPDASALSPARCGMMLYSRQWPAPERPRRPSDRRHQWPQRSTGACARSTGGMPSGAARWSCG